MLGAKDTEIADVFGVSEVTLNNWKSKHPEFLQSLREGKTVADAEVAERLYQRAMGYEHPEDDIRTVSIAGGGSEIVITPTIKRYPPDTTAGIFWLKNRQRDKWRDKVETGITDNEGKDVKPPDLNEAARRIAFILAKATFSDTSESTK